MNNLAFIETKENVNKHIDIKTFDNKKKKKLFGTPFKLSHDKDIFSKNVLAIEKRKPKIAKNKPIYLVLSI